MGFVFVVTYVDALAHLPMMPLICPLPPALVNRESCIVYRAEFEVHQAILLDRLDLRYDVI